MFELASSAFTKVLKNGGADVGNVSAPSRGMTSIVEHVRTLMFNEQDADVHFVFPTSLKKKHKPIPAHKFVLTRCSASFRDVFAVDNTVRQIEVTDVTPEAFVEFLRWMYIGSAQIKAIDVAFEVLGLAQSHRIPLLSEAINAYLLSNLRTSNVCTYLFHWKLLEMNVLNSVMECTDLTGEAVLSSQAFVDFEELLVLRILGRDSLMVPEIKVYHALKRWAEAKDRRIRSLSYARGPEHAIVEQSELSAGTDLSASRLRSALGGLIYKVRFGTMSPEEFADQGPALDGILTVEEAFAFTHSFCSKKHSAMKFPKYANILNSFDSAPRRICMKEKKLLNVDWAQLGSVFSMEPSSSSTTNQSAGTGGLERKGSIRPKKGSIAQRLFAPISSTSVPTVSRLESVLPMVSSKAMVPTRAMVPTAPTMEPTMDMVPLTPTLYPSSTLVPSPTRRRSSPEPFHFPYYS